ncbi:MAG: 50S ribosomal protein L13 [Candidatus Omnitrophota bacterium]
MQKTIAAQARNIKRKWYLIDAKGKILGRIATKAATILRGKHKAIFTPSVDCGDYLVVINAKDVCVTGKKLEQKVYNRYSGYPGGLKQIPLKEMFKKNPQEIIRHAVRGMLPKGSLGRDMLRKLKIYATDKHFQQAQMPETLEV